MSTAEALRPKARDLTPAIYGSLLTTTLVAVMWRADVLAAHIGLALVGSVVVFWLTHVWSGIVNLRVRGPVERPALIRIGVEEAPMLWAAIVPTIVLGVGATGIIGLDLAVELALLVSIVQLFLWGLAVGRAAHASWPLALRVAAVDCALGISIVVLKVALIH